MAKKNKRSLEDGYDMYNPAPFIENNPSFKYYADNINPIYVDNNTGEVWQNNKPKGSVVLPDIEVKGKNLKAIEAGRNIRQEKGLKLTYPELDLFMLARPGVANLVDNVTFNLNKGYNDIINDIMKATYYNARFAEKPGTISKATFMKHIYDLNPPKVKTNPLEYFKDGNIKDLLKSKAYYDNVNNKIVINPLSLLFNDNNSYKGLIAHEATHAFKDFNPLRLSIFDKGPYHIPNPELGSVLKPFNRAASKGKWEGSPEELRAEMYRWKYNIDDLFTPYKKSKNRKRYIKNAMNRFDLNKYDAARTLDALSNLGYF